MDGTPFAEKLYGRREAPREWRSGEPPRQVADFTAEGMLRPVRDGGEYPPGHSFGLMTAEEATDAHRRAARWSPAQRGAHELEVGNGEALHAAESTSLQAAAEVGFGAPSGAERVWQPQHVERRPHPRSTGPEEAASSTRAGS